MTKITFKLRGFVSLLTTFSFLISLVSGIILYFTPQGKIANWTNWTFWGLDKHTWGAMHINSSLIFFIIALFHIYYNWKLLSGYFKKRAKMAVNLKLEMAFTLIFSLFIILASIYGFQPFGTIMKWNFDIKNYWANNTQVQPPIPHAEELTVNEFCEKFNIDIKVFIAKLNQHGWEFENNSQQINEIAQKNTITPSEIYAAITNTNGARSGGRAGGGVSLGNTGGWGRKTVAMICEENNKSVETALLRLTKKGAKANKSTNLRDIASQLGIRPSDVFEIITGGKSKH